MLSMTLDGKGRVTLPDVVRRKLGLTKGDMVILRETEHGTFELIPAELVPRDQAWFYHPEMQARLRAAEESVRAGTAVATRTPEEAQAFLDGLKRAEPQD